MRSASSLVTRSLVTTARSMPRAPKRGDQAFDQRRLAGADRTADADTRRRRGRAAILTVSASPQHVPLGKRQHFRRLAGGELAVDEHIEGLRDRPGCSGRRHCAACAAC